MTCHCLQLSNCVIFSFRWLFAKGKNAEGKSVSQLIAKRNGVALPEHIWDSSLNKSEVRNSRSPFLYIAEIFKTKNVCSHFCRFPLVALCELFLYVYILQTTQSQLLRVQKIRSELFLMTNAFESWSFLHICLFVTAAVGKADITFQ